MHCCSAVSVCIVCSVVCPNICLVCTFVALNLSPSIGTVLLSVCICVKISVDDLKRGSQRIWIDNILSLHKGGGGGRRGSEG